MSESLSAHLGQKNSASKRSHAKKTQIVLYILAFFHLGAGLFNASVLSKYILKHTQLVGVPLSTYSISLFLFNALLMLLFFSLAYAYLKKSAWGWYFSFPQILISVLLMHPTFFILIYLGSLMSSHSTQISSGALSQPSQWMSVLLIITMGLEVVKLAFFLHPATKQYFLSSVSMKQKRYYQKILSGLLFIIFTLFVLMIFPTLYSFLFSQ